MEQPTWKRYLQAGLTAIDTRETLVSELREVALSPYAYSVVETIVAKLAGRMDFTIDGTPERIRLADGVFTTAWRKLVQPTVENALRDYIATGFSGVFMSPYGVRRLRAEDSTWLGEITRPIGHVRRFSMPYADARERYGDQWQKDNPEDLIDFAEVYLQYEGRLVHVSLTGEATVVAEWENYPYETHYLFGAERPRSNPHYQTGLPIGIIEVARDNIAIQDRITAAALARMQRARIAQLNVSSVTDADSVEALSASYKLIPSATPNPLIMPIDEVSPTEVQLFSDLSERKISTLTGVGLYDQNIMPRTETATEAMYYAQLGSARAQYQLERARIWLGEIASDFRHWLVRLPVEEVPLLRVMIDDTEEVFGPHRHIKEALEGMRVTLVGAGWEDVLSRQQRAQMMLALMQAMPQAFNVAEVVAEYLRAINADPSRYLLSPSTDSP